MTETKCIALLLLAMAVTGTHTVTSLVVDSGPGIRFGKDIGDFYAWQTLDDASQFVWNTFAQQSPTDRKNVSEIDLFVSEKATKLGSITYVEGNNIYVSSAYINTFPGDVKREVTGILYQGVADILQWDANGTAPKWWHGAIPSYVRLIAGFPYSNFAKPGSGSTWEHGVDITARFIEYLDTVTPGFVAKLNAKIRTSWDLLYFNDITGKSVEQLWSDYKAKYGNIP